MQILITGASGLLGLNLALELSRTHQVFGLVNSNNLKTDRFEVIKGNLLNEGEIQKVLDQSQPDWVIHCAALANLDECEHNPDLARKLNTQIPEKLAQYVAKGGARLVHISTDAVFDGQTGGYRETDSPNPINTYARSKLDAERLVLIANPDAIVARVNLFGWSLSGKRSLSEFFFNNLSDGNPIMGFTDVFFCPLFVNDMAHIFEQMLIKKLTGLYHVASSDSASKFDFGTRIAEIFGFDKSLISPISVQNGKLHTVRSPRLTLDVDKLTTALRVKPPTIDMGIQNFFKLYQQGYPDILKNMRTV